MDEINTPACVGPLQVGGLFTAALLQCCGTCGGAGRVTCGRCRGAGMANSWLWKTDMSRPSDTPGLKGSFDERVQEVLRDAEGFPDGFPDGGGFPGDFSSPAYGGGRKRQTFREKVRERQRQRRREQQDQ